MKPKAIQGGQKLSSFIEPMKAKLADTGAFDSEEWIYEIKWDGYRAISELLDGKVKLYSMNGITFDKAYPKIYNALLALKINAILDGEIVVFDEKGKPSFEKMQNYQNTDKFAIHYYVFDCLKLNGKSLEQLPLIERKEALRKALPPSELIRYCDHEQTNGKAFFDAVVKMNLEGMIAKRSRSRYYPGRRSADWLKFKNSKEQDAIIVGFTQPKGSRGYFGSLALALYEKRKLKYIGNVGTGFTEQTLKKLYQQLQPLIRNTSPLPVEIAELKDAIWVEPEIVCNITLMEMTQEGIIRHPVFHGIRIDKSPSQVVLAKVNSKSEK